MAREGQRAGAGDSARTRDDQVADLVRSAVYAGSCRGIEDGVRGDGGTCTEGEGAGDLICAGLADDRAEFTDVSRTRDDGTGTADGEVVAIDPGAIHLDGAACRHGHAACAGAEGAVATGGKHACVDCHSTGEGAGLVGLKDELSVAALGDPAVRQRGCDEEYAVPIDAEVAHAAHEVDAAVAELAEGVADLDFDAFASVGTADEVAAGVGHVAPELQHTAGAGHVAAAAGAEEDVLAVQRQSARTDFKGGHGGGCAQACGDVEIRRSS